MGNIQTCNSSTRTCVFVFVCVWERQYKVYTNELSKVEYIECGKIKKEYRVSHLDFEMLKEEISVPLYSL